MAKDGLKHKKLLATQRAKRTRSRIHGTNEKPRLSVNISHKHVAAQLIDDQNGKTLAHVTTLKQPDKGTLTNKAAWVGAEIAKKAVKRKVTQVILDRGSRRYHGRLKKLAEEARAGGLEF